ncbi:MAG TPA: NYN domain-containing protein [Sedimentisphaerales bacterium]|nr:NYN domain-containing protein [Sedimentisphaerales bacterium]
MPIIIDGYNLLWAVQKVGHTHEAITEVQLCHVVGRYIRATGEKGEIVFDGAGPPEKTRFDNITHLEVSFSGLAADADKVIEDKIKASTAPKNLTVVSSDRQVRAAAHARKAQTLKSEVFWQKLTAELTRTRPAEEPPAKRWGLTDVETEHWMKFFGIEP